jgi:hypothetical protein
MALQLPPQRSDDAAAREEDLADLRIGDQIQVTLPVTRFHIFQAVPFLGHGEQCLGQIFEALHVYAQLTGARAEQVAFHADNVAQVEALVDGEIALGDSVLLDVNLEALAVLRQMREARLTHTAQSLHAPGDADVHGRRELFRGLRPILGQDSGDRVSELEALAVGPESQRLDFANAREALL